MNTALIGGMHRTKEGERMKLLIEISEEQKKMVDAFVDLPPQVENDLISAIRHGMLLPKKYEQLIKDNFEVATVFDDDGIPTGYMYVPQEDLYYIAVNLIKEAIDDARASIPKLRDDMLDEIRARVELEKLGYPPSAGYYKAIMKCLQIIDKYKAESEDSDDVKK